MKNMVQIEKKKKKGRPSKADLEARRNPMAAVVSKSPANLTAAEKEKRDERRRSLRRRSFRYNIIDYDEDYLDDNEVFEEKDDDEEDDDEIRRGGKKVKLVVKLNNNNNNNSNSSGEEKGPSRGDSVTRPSRRGRVTASRDSEEEERDREVKRQRINGGVEKDEDLDEDDDDVDDDVENGGYDIDEVDEVVFTYDLLQMSVNLASKV